METINQNITPEGNFTLSYFPNKPDAEPHTPLEEAIQFIYDCWNYEEEYHPKASRTKKQLLGVINDVLLPACEEGNQDAIYCMYFAYDKGIGVEQDEEKALEYLKILAEYGYPDMQCELGIYYRIVDWCDNQRKMNLEAVRWFTKAAKHGVVEAMCYLGECYEYVFGVRHSDRKALLWYKRAAERGNEEAMWKLGLCYQRGIWVKKDLAIAAEWYDKAGMHEKAERLRNGEDELAEDKDGFSLYPMSGLESDDSLLSCPVLELDNDNVCHVPDLP